MLGAVECHETALLLWVFVEAYGASLPVQRVSVSVVYDSCVYVRASQVTSELSQSPSCAGVCQRWGGAMRTGPERRCREHCVFHSRRRVGDVGQTWFSSCGNKVGAELSVGRRESLFCRMLSLSGLR